jgi:hypothetical protein
LTASATAWTRFEEKPCKLPGFSRKIVVARGLPCLADPAGPASASPVGSPATAAAPISVETGLQKLAANAAEEVA